MTGSTEDGRMDQQPAFIPFLFADGETTIANSNSIFVLTGGHEKWTMIRVPNRILEMPVDCQLKELRKLMTAYRREFRGCVPFFGKLTGFKFVRCFDYLQFDAQGRFVKHVGEIFRPPECAVMFR